LSKVGQTALYLFAIPKIQFIRDWAHTKINKGTNMDNLAINEEGDDFVERKMERKRRFAYCVTTNSG
jgi:hypothetical protein